MAGADVPSHPKEESAKLRPTLIYFVPSFHGFCTLAFQLPNDTPSSFYEVRPFETEEALYDRQVQALAHV